MRKEPNPPAPEGVKKPDPPPGPPKTMRELQAAKLAAETEILKAKGDKLRGKLPSAEPAMVPPIFDNPTAQRAYEALMDDARMREKDLKSTSLCPNDIHQFMLDAHAQAIRTAYDIVTEGVRAVDGKR